MPLAQLPQAERRETDAHQERRRWLGDAGRVPRIELAVVHEPQGRLSVVRVVDVVEGRPPLETEAALIRQKRYVEIQEWSDTSGYVLTGTRKAGIVTVPVPPQPRHERRHFRVVLVPNSGAAIEGQAPVIGTG